MQPVLAPLAAALLAAVVLPATAQDFPSRPVRFIVSAAPGGSTDVLARVISVRLAERWKQQVVVDNRPGASSILGTELIARAPADGHTIGMTFTGHTVNPSLYRKLPYDSIADFAPVTPVTKAPLVLVVSPSLGVNSAAELIALARKKPLVYGSSGNGSGGHLCGEQLKMLTGIDVPHIPYKGAAPASADVAAGQTHFQFAAQLTMAGLVRAGKLRMLAVSTAQRSPSLPDLPAMAETVPGFDFTNWFGVLSPANTPSPVVAKLHRDIVAVLAIPEVKERLGVDGSEVFTLAPAAFTEFMRAEIARWAKVVKTQNMRVD